jgi:hypothetical protein
MGEIEEIKTVVDNEKKTIDLDAFVKQYMESQKDTAQLLVMLCLSVQKIEKGLANIFKE